MCEVGPPCLSHSPLGQWIYGPKSSEDQQGIPQETLRRSSSPLGSLGECCCRLDIGPHVTNTCPLHTLTDHERCSEGTSRGR